MARINGFLTGGVVALALGLLCGRALGQTEPQDGAELIANPTFAEKAKGWLLRTGYPDETVRHGDSPSVQLAGVKPGPGAWSHAGVVILACGWVRIARRPARLFRWFRRH